MLAYLKGQIIKITEKAAIIGQNGVGYLVYSSSNQLAALQEQENLAAKTEVELFIHSHIREDAFDLYGFSTYQQLELFKTLISVNGIGPKVGLELINAPINDLKAAIAHEDVNYIKKTPGIGPKTAKRIILELKGKIESETLDYQYQESSQIDSDVIEALTQLGYHQQQIKRGLKDLPENITGAEEVISYFLKNRK